MVLRPTPMSRVTVVGLKEHEDRILSFLHDRRVLQIEPVSKEALSAFAPARPTEVQRKLAEEHLRFKALVAALPPVPVPTPREFADVATLLRFASRVSCDDAVRSAKREEDAILTESKLLEDQVKVVRDFAFFPEDLAVLRARSVLSYLGEADAEAFAAFQSDVGKLSHDVYLQAGGDAERVRFVLSVPREKAEAFGRLAQQHAIALQAVPDLEGTPRELLPRLEARSTELAGRLSQVRERLLEISRTWYPVLLPIEEQLAVEARKADVHGRLATAQEVFALEGFVPTPEVKTLREALDRLTGGRSELFDQPGGDDAPTQMKNPPGTSVYEFFIRFFSIPQSSEIDPTLVFAFVFPIFFGFMLGDVGYGGFILAVCLWMIWRIGNPNAGPTLVPGFLVRFTTMVVPPPAMKQLAKCLVPGCLVAIALGVLFDSYFGFTLGQLTGGAFDFAPLPGAHGLPAPVTYMAKLLLLAVYVGLGMVTLGLAFGAVNSYFHHQVKHLLSRFFWMATAWGILFLGLSLVTHYPGSWLLAYPAYRLVYIAIFAVGVVGVLVTEGAFAAFEIATIMSHVLSYARLVGILLASVILAYVINGIAVIGISGQAPLLAHGLGYALFAVVLVVVGAVFNIVLGVFEPGIQGARLLYVEHFSKFYHGNGKPFLPFGGRRQHTLPPSPPSAAPAATPAGAPRPPAATAP